MNRSRQRTFILGLAALAIVLIGLSIYFLSGMAADNGGHAWVSESADSYRATLAVSTDPAEQAILKEKLARLEQMESNRLFGQQNAAEKPEEACVLRPTALPGSTEVQTAGIQEGGQAPVSPEDFAQANSWQGEVRGQWLRVYAGARADDASQGILYVLVDNTADFGEYPAPAGSGSLRVVDVQDGRLILEGAGGVKLYFDLPGRVFAASLEEKVEPLPLAPTLEPTAGPCGP